jgi:DNA-directed RNA polymerase specialized sigma24 family protein
LAEDLEDAFREHSRLVYRTAYSVTGSAQDAEDVVQTSSCSCSGAGFPPAFKENPKGYLYRAAVNLSLNAVKSRKRRASGVDPEQLEVRTHGSTSARPRERRPAGTARRRHRTTQSPRCGDAHPRYEHDTSEAEIGRLLGTSRAVVAVTLFRARARLKKLLRDNP